MAENKYIYINAGILEGTMKCKKKKTEVNKKMGGALDVALGSI